MKFVFIVTGVDFHADFRVHREGCPDIPSEMRRSNSSYTVTANTAIEAIASEERTWKKQGLDDLTFDILPCCDKKEE